MKQNRYLDQKAFCSWLGVLTKRRTLNFVREMKKSYQLPEILDIMPDSSILPDIETLRSQVIDFINQKLSDQERLVMLYFLDGLAQEEIAKLMGLKLSTVFIIKKKAISDIKAFFKTKKNKSNNQ